MAIGMLAGMLLSLGVVFAIEWIDDRLRTPDDIRRRLGLQCLGLMPELRGSRPGAAPLLQPGVAPSFVEAVRALRTSVMAATIAKPRHMIVVAGTREGEGKSLVASSLAISLAQARQNVLLVDADMRRPQVHALLDAPLQPGLSNVLEGGAAFREILHPTTLKGLTVIAAGGPSLQAPELLGSVQTQSLFEILQEHFDWIVIDSPPVLNVTDATVMARMASGVVLVVGSGMTSARAARRAVDELQAGGATVLGAVLNRADLDQHPFYFSPYSRGEYRLAARRPSPAVVGKSA